MSTQYNKIVENVDLHIEPIFTDLMRTSTGRGSAYLKAKETILDYVDKTNLTEVEKANLISQSIAQLAQSITSESMQVALKIAQENRDAPFLLTKSKEETRLTTARVVSEEQNAINIEAEVDTKAMAIKKAQAELYRDYGVNLTNLSPDVPSMTFSEYGTKVETIKMSQANVYNGYATAYRQNGIVTPTIDDKGWLTTGTVGDDNGLSFWQTKVATRQVKGFDDNARQHVVNSSATMVSMLLSSEEESLVADARATLDKWKVAANHLIDLD